MRRKKRKNSRLVDSFWTSGTARHRPCKLFQSHKIKLIIIQQDQGKATNKYRRKLKLVSRKRPGSERKSWRPRRRKERKRDQRSGSTSRNSLENFKRKSRREKRSERHSACKESLRLIGISLMRSSLIDTKKYTLNNRKRNFWKTSSTRS